MFSVTVTTSSAVFSPAVPLMMAWPTWRPSMTPLSLTWATEVSLLLHRILAGGMSSFSMTTVAWMVYWEPASMLTCSWVRRISSTPGAVSTTTTLPLATVSPSMVAPMVAWPVLLAERVQTTPSPLTETTLLSLLLQTTSTLSAFSTPLRVASAVSPTTMFWVEKEMVYLSFPPPPKKVWISTAARTMTTISRIMGRGLIPVLRRRSFRCRLFRLREEEPRRS